MCARFTLKSSSDVIGGLFDLEDLPPLLPRYNIAPTQDVLAILESGQTREAAMLRWGLLPPWTSDINVGSRMINARAETVSEKTSYKNAFRKRRCLIPADGFYEWTDPDPVDEDLGGLFGDPNQTAKKPLRQPHWIGMKDQSIFAMAGIWELNQQTELGSVETCCIITTGPNELLEPMHDRMPVILPPDLWDLWLDPDFESIEVLESMLVPFDAEKMSTHKVDPAINNPRIEGRKLAEILEGGA